MTWSALSLSEPASNAPALTNKISVFTVSPWDLNSQEGEGLHTWLSFPNAVEAVADHVDSTQAIFAIAIAAASWIDFAQQAATLAHVLPIKQLTQWQRHADALATIELDKLNLIDAVSASQSTTLAALATINQRSRKQLSQQALTEASALTTADPLANLTAFESAKNSHVSTVNTPLPALSGGAGFRFYADTASRTQLRAGALNDSYIYTAMLVFQGTPADLAYLVEMMP